MTQFDNRDSFRLNGESFATRVPFLGFSQAPSDITIIYLIERDRLDRLSLRYYGQPDLGWVILQANPQYTLEGEIPDGGVLRIPLPLDRLIAEYNYLAGDERRL